MIDIRLLPGFVAALGLKWGKLNLESKVKDFLPIDPRC